MSIQEVVKKALLYDWDPIGVKNISGAEHEYDGYVPTICKMLEQRKSKQEIVDYLWWIETGHMGLPGNKEATTAFVDRLIAISFKK